MSRKSNPSEADRAGDELMTITRAFRAKPNSHNRAAVISAMDSYREAVMRDFLGDPPDADVLPLESSKRKAG